MNKERTWNLTERNFGPLWPYIIDDSITDVDWDSDALWVKYSDGRKELSAIKLTPEFIENFASYVANHESKAFNATNNELTAETDTLRITIVHETFATSGTCFSIRKSLPKLRFTATEALSKEYCSKEGLALLINSVKAGLNFAFCGEPGSGKTECVKFCSSFIPNEDKVVTIEDVLELHYKDIAEGKRGIELKVNEEQDYVTAIKVALRLNPHWIMLSEARSREVKYLLESWSAGVRGMTTLHTDDVRNIPDRIVNMVQENNIEDRFTNNVYMYLDVAVLLQETLDENMNRSRKIKQICFYYRENGENKCHMVMDDFVVVSKDIPEGILRTFQQRGIDNPFESQLLNDRLEAEKNIYEVN